MNAGFEPQNEILRLLGARMTYDPAVGHLRCERSETLETSVSGIFAVGDCAGLGGAPAACAEGRIAGCSAAARSGHGDGRGLSSDRRALRRYRRFQDALWQLHDLSPTPLDSLPEDTVLCRCEEVTVGETLAGYALSPGHLGTLKRTTRIGMGPCQGRYCAPAAARLIAGKTGEALTDRSFFAPRVPVKPVTINAILSPKRRFAVTSDFLVIGGGIVGRIAALELAGAGARVTLVDAAQNAGSTTNAGSLHVQMQSRFIRLYPEHAQNVERALPYYRQAAECWDTLEAGLGPMHLVRKGGLMLAESAGQMAFLEDKSRREEAKGLDVALLDRAELDRLAPWIGPRIVGAELCRNEGSLNPLLANSCWRRLARTWG